MSGHAFSSAKSDDESVLSASVCERTQRVASASVCERTPRMDQQKPATPTQPASAVGAPLRWMVASISPYGRSAA